MSIDSVSSTVVSTASVTVSGITGSNAPSGPAPADRDPDGGGRIRGGFGALITSIFEALGQAGVGQPAQSGQTSSSTQTSDSSGSGSSAQSPLQALESFLQTLFQALAGEPGGGQSSNGSASSGHHHHGGLVAKLQALLQDVGGNSSSSDTNQGNTSDLSSAFQNLVSALGGSASGAGAPTLQSFLQNLIQDLQSHGGSSTAAMGGVVSASA